MYNIYGDNMDKWIDLTVLIDEEYKEYPGDIPFSIKLEKEYSVAGCNISRLETNMHIGTHLDAKKHALDTNEGIETIDINKLIGKAQVIKPLIINNIIQTESIINQYENRYKIIILNLNFASNFNTKAYYDFPKFKRDIIPFFLEKEISVIGFDMPSPVFVNEENMEMHKALLSNDITILENLTNLNSLSRYIDLIALPLKIKGLDGSLIRCVAKNRKND